MMKFLCQRLRCPVLLLLLALGQGATPVLSEEVQEQAPRIGFSCLHWDEIPEEKLYYREGEHYHPIKFRHGARSEIKVLEGMSDFELYGERENPQQGEMPYVLLGKVVIPADIRDVLFYIIADKKEGKPDYQIITMDDSLEAFPRGMFRFVNLSGRELSVEFSGQTRHFAIGQIAEMPYKILDGGGTFVPCVIRAAVKEQIAPSKNDQNEEQDQEAANKAVDREKILFGTRLFGQPNGREIVVMRPSPVEGSERLKLKFYNQLIPRQLPQVN
ncbi:MAG: hypothetical protein ACPIG6_07225 [Akkermansiaceae bacterium]